MNASTRLLMESALAEWPHLELPADATWEWVEAVSGQDRLDVLRAFLDAHHDMTTC